MVGAKSPYRVSLQSIFWLTFVLSLLVVLFLKSQEILLLEREIQRGQDVSLNKTPADIRVSSRRIVDSRMIGVLSIEITTASPHIVTLNATEIETSHYDLERGSEASRVMVIACRTSQGDLNISIHTPGFEKAFVEQDTQSIELGHFLPEFGSMGVYDDGVGRLGETVFESSRDHQIKIQVRREFTKND